MNERIKELAEQATDEYHYSTWNSTDQKEVKHYKFNKEKFAELIVRECHNVVFKNTGPRSALNILEHFGLEE
jgi:hypothetical protein